MMASYSSYSSDEYTINNGQQAVMTQMSADPSFDGSGDGNQNIVQRGAGPRRGGQGAGGKFLFY